MNIELRNALCVFGVALLLPVTCRANEAVYPLKISANGRYFVDQNGAPVFWLGTTQWQLFRDNSLEDAVTILTNAKGKGFNVIQVMLFGPGDGTKPNLVGDKPWAGVDPLTPNEAYFQRVDTILRIAREKNVVVALMPYHQLWRKLITETNARQFAKWLAERYKDEPTIVWSLCPRAEAEYVGVCRELAAGLRDGDGGKHLITVHPDPAPFSSSFLHGEPWLDFHCIQVWRDLQLIYPMVAKDYNLQPVKPVVMAEGAYEAGTEYGFDVTPSWVRRQAYYTYLLGAHHSYGHNDSWRNLPTQMSSLDAPGATQLGILKKFFLERDEWWNIVPDQSLLSGGGKTDGRMLNLAARHKDGLWAVIYVAEKATVMIDTSKLAGGGPLSWTWIDPRSGTAVSTGKVPGGGLELSTPDGLEDALLLVERSAKE